MDVLRAGEGMTSDSEGTSRNERLIGATERFLLLTLRWALLIIVLATTADLVISLVINIADPPKRFRLEVLEMVSAVGSFLLVLIGLELIETLRIYQEKNAIRVELVLAVALTAMARKIILLVGKEPPAEEMLGVAGIIAALGIAIFLVGRRRE